MTQELLVNRKDRLGKVPAYNKLDVIVEVIL